MSGDGDALLHKTKHGFPANLYCLQIFCKYKLDFSLIDMVMITIIVFWRWTYSSAQTKHKFPEDFQVFSFLLLKIYNKGHCLWKYCWPLLFLYCPKLCIFFPLQINTFSLKLFQMYLFYKFLYTGCFFFIGPPLI